jgi:putative NADH-flavin reductase
MARILVIGASRGIGRETVKRGLEAGHAIRAMSRGASDLGITDARLEPLAGDATDAARVEEALRDMDAVIQTLGIRVTPQTWLGPVSLFSRATEVLVAAMEAKGPRRLLAVTGIGTGDSRTALSTLENVAKDLALGAIYRDKSLQETMIRNSGLDWTIVRPTFLTPGRRTGRYHVFAEPGTWRNGLISRADVADFLIREVDSETYLHRAPVLAY